MTFEFRETRRPTRQNQEADLWRWVDRGSEDECWPWTGHVSSSGYGRLRVRTKQVMAHRIAYLLGHGVDPGAMLVCHRCDNRLCCNPSHLFLGTTRDNALDARDKGRLFFPRGSRHGRAKLTEENVVEIRERATTGEAAAALAQAFSVSIKTIRSAIDGTTWRHLA